VLGDPGNPNPDNTQVPATSAEKTTEHEADALYARGMAHYRRREWNEAKACFERLKAIAPERRVVDALLNEVDMFIQLPAMQPEQPKTALAGAASAVGRAEAGAARGAVESRVGRRGLLGPVLAIIMSLLMILALILYATGTLDTLIGNQRQARVQSLVNQGRAAMTVGDYDRAVEAYGQALALSPNNEEIKTWYAKAQRSQQLTSLCARVEEDIADGLWVEALDKLQTIQEMDPTYCNVSEKIDFVKSQQTLDARLAEAEEQFSQSQWAEAIRSLEELQEEAPTFRTSEVQRTLFLAYFRQGVEWMARAGDALDLVNQAIQSFDSALSIDPNDASAVEEQRLASLYRQGYLFVNQKDWPQAVNVLRQIYNSRPGYMEGRVTAMLCTSYLKLGDAYNAAGNLEEALQQYRNVLAIENCDHVEAAIKEREVYTILNPPTPTPTRTATPTNTPRATQTPTRTVTPSPTPSPPPPPPPPPTLPPR